MCIIRRSLTMAYRRTFHFSFELYITTAGTIVECALKIYWQVIRIFLHFLRVEKYNKKQLT